MGEGKVINLNEFTGPTSKPPLEKRGIPLGERGMSALEEFRKKQEFLTNEKEATALNMKNINEMREFIKNNNMAKFTPDRRAAIKKYNQVLKNKTNEEMIKLANESSVIDWREAPDYYTVLLSQLRTRKLTP